MSNENKIRILYVQPGKYPEEQFIANELHPLQRLVGGYMQAVWKKSKSAFCPTVFACRAFSFCGTYLVERRIAWQMCLTLR